MKFAWKLGLAAMLAAGFIGNVSPTWAEEPAAEEKATEGKFAPESVDDGMKQMTTFLRSGGPEQLPPKERYAKVVEMIDTMWGMERSEEQTKRLLSMKIQLLLTLKDQGDETADKQLSDFIAKLEADGDTQLVAQAEGMLFALKLNKLRTMSPEERKATLNEIKAELMASTPTLNSATQASQLASYLSYNLEPKEAAKEIGEIAEHFQGTENEEIEEATASMMGIVRRFNLPGNPIELTGTKLNGEDLHFPSAFKGKVVLVDFWATWCGPCIGEFPNMKKLYATYHDHGFEIVGISLDDTKEPVEKMVEERELPWTIVWNETAEGVSGWKNANAVRYGINGIPTMIFVDKDGTVKSITARGKNLEKLLAEAFPDVKVEEEKAEAKKEGAE